MSPVDRAWLLMARPTNPMGIVLLIVLRRRPHLQRLRRLFSAKASLVASNLPGPSRPLHLTGARSQGAHRAMAMEFERLVFLVLLGAGSLAD